MFKIVNNGFLPEAQNEYAAGFDVFANEDIELKPGWIRTVRLGFQLDISLKDYKNFFFGIYLRESLGKKGVMLVNGVGIINIDSKEEISLQLFNPLTDPSSYENRTYHIKKGDRIAQIILQRTYRAEAPEYIKK